MVGALGGLLFGFDTAVVSGTTHQLTQVFQLSAYQLGITVSIALVGTVLGALTSGALGQRIGSREALRWMALLYLVSSLGCALAWSWHSLLAFRLIGGLGIGGSSVLGPVYIAEMAPARIRGRLVGLFQINIVIGILLAYASNFGIATVVANGHTWRWQLGVAALPALLFFLLLFGVPRSARWLLTQGRTEEARDVLALLGSQNAQAEVEELHNAIHTDTANASAPLFTRSLRLPIFLAFTIGLFNQLAGINAILYYLNDIFREAGFSSVSVNTQTVIIGLMNLVATLLGASVVDRLGRKTLLLAGAAATALCLLGIAVIFSLHTHMAWLLWLLVAYIFFFALSQGLVIWIYISEVFPTRVRAKGQSLGAGTHWVANAAVSFAFPVIAKHSAGAPFYFFAAMTALQFFVVLFVYPETKGVSLEELEKKLGIELG